MVVTKRAAERVQPAQRRIHGRSTRESPQTPAGVSRWGPRHFELSQLRAQASWRGFRLPERSYPGG